MGEPEALTLEMHGKEHRTARENNRALDSMLQLSYVAGPIVTLEQSECVWGDPREIFLRLVRTVRGKTIG